MSAFPTLTSKYSVEDYDEMLAFDPTNRTQMESGHIRTSPSCTYVPQAWRVRLGLLSEGDKKSIREFEREMKLGSGSFLWSNPVTGDSLTVRFKDTCKYRMQGSRLFWEVEYVVEEV